MASTPADDFDLYDDSSMMLPAVEVCLCACVVCNVCVCMC